jgi:Xaa-Pro aminopeptidase
MNIFEENRKDLIRRMETASVLLLDSGSAKHKTTDQFFHYVPNRNFFYVTGLNEENVRLMILKNEDTVKELLFIEETTEYMRQWVGEKISKEEASKVTGIPVSNIHYIDSFCDTFKSMMTYARGLGVKPPKNLYLDLYRYKANVRPVSLSIFEDIVNNYKELNIKNVNEHFSYLRMLKSDYEISQLEEAIRMTDVGLKRIMDALKFRTNEQQIEADFLHEITLQGSEGNSFNTIAASGAHATVLHYEDNNGDLNQGDLLLCDLGALHNNYGSDITRTYPISGTFSDRQKVLYEIVLKTNKESIKFVKPGITWKQLNDFAKNILITECKKIDLIKEDEEINKYYYHSIGHFLGLDVHDVGQYDLKLKEGMVITIEPGLYIKEEGIGIRIEDDILVTKNGSLNLSEGIMKEIEDIEKYMA